MVQIVYCERFYKSPHKRCIPSVLPSTILAWVPYGYCYASNGTKCNLGAGGYRNSSCNGDCVLFVITAASYAVYRIYPSGCIIYIPGGGQEIKTALGLKYPKPAVLSQIIVIFNKDTRKYKPYAFTEQGVSMLSSVINSERAIEVNINIMRTFVKLRHYVLSKSDNNEQIAELRKLLMLYIEKNDKRVNEIIIALNNLIEHPPKTKKIGFDAGN
jgi:hypothetical protein